MDTYLKNCSLYISTASLGVSTSEASEVCYQTNTFSSCQVKNGAEMNGEKSHVDPLASSFRNSVLSKCCRSFCAVSLQLLSYR